MRTYARFRRKPLSVLAYRKSLTGTWRERRMRRVHRERLPHGADPEPRVLELIAEIEAGRFRPNT